MGAYRGNRRVSFYLLLIKCVLGLFCVSFIGMLVVEMDRFNFFFWEFYR